MGVCILPFQRSRRQWCQQVRRGNFLRHCFMGFELQNPLLADDLRLRISAQMRNSPRIVIVSSESDTSSECVSKG